MLELLHCQSLVGFLVINQISLPLILSQSKILMCYDLWKRKGLMNANNDIPRREQRVFAPGRAHRYKPEFRLSFQGSFLLSSRPASCWQEETLLWKFHCWWEYSNYPQHLHGSEYTQLPAKRITSPSIRERCFSNNSKGHHLNPPRTAIFLRRLTPGNKYSICVKLYSYTE